VSPVVIGFMPLKAMVFCVCSCRFGCAINPPIRLRHDALHERLT
jgi:hypothetical protein